MATSITGQGIAAYKAPDDALSSESKNAVQNKVIDEELSDVKNAISQLGDIAAFKTAILQLAQKVAYIDDDGEKYYQDLRDSLYPVSSITAAYTQSGYIYDVDNLSVLVPDLVVTAIRTDGSIYTVTSDDYVLSGVLAVGTSTITVTYSGKTATFSVIVTSVNDYVLPSGYTRYDYVRNLSAAGVIDTDGTAFH